MKLINAMSVSMTKMDSDRNKFVKGFTLLGFISPVAFRERVNIMDLSREPGY